MPIPTVWTERGEVAGVVGWHDCTQSAVLMCLIYAGWTKFPLGAYTMQERNAFESSDDRKDNTGALLTDTDLALRRRYGVTMRRLPDDTEATFRRFLNEPGHAFVVQGFYRDLPDHLRRWQPSFTSGHAVCVITLGGGKQLLLDPLATANYQGDVTDTDTVLKFAWDGAQYSRYLNKDELMTVTRKDTIWDKPKKIICRTGGPINAYLYPSHDVAKTITLKRQSWFTAKGVAHVTGWSEADPKKTWDYWIPVDGYFATPAGLLVSQHGNLTVLDEPTPEEVIARQAHEIANLQTQLAAAETATSAADDKRKSAEEALAEVARLRTALQNFLK